MNTRQFRDYRRPVGALACAAVLGILVPPGGGDGSRWWAALGPAAAWATPVLIDFDDLPGMPGPYIPGMPVPPQYIVDDRYLDQGVLFNSAGGGIVIAAPNNPVSPPNVAAATGPGPTLSTYEPTYGSFWMGTVSTTVDWVSITTTPSTSNFTPFSAYASDGTFLGAVYGGGGSTLTVTFPGQIHSVQIGPNLPGAGYAFDDFEYDGLIPEPASAALVILGALVACARQRRATIGRKRNGWRRTLYEPCGDHTMSP